MKLAKTLILCVVMVSLAVSCGEKKKESGKSDGVTAIPPQTSCTHLVAKLSECMNNKQVTARFSFNEIKDWVYEDCEKLQKENAGLFGKLMTCVNMDCPRMDTCLEEVLGKWQEKR